MKIGYARVSTLEQNLDLQKDALEKTGCEKIYTDEVSGTVAERPGLLEAQKDLRKGDVLVVWRLDRLGRSIRDLIEWTAMLENKGIGFQSLQESIDTTNTSGTTTYFVYDGWSLIEEYDASDTPTQLYLHGPRIDEIIMSYRFNTNQTTYYQHDRLGSTILLTDQIGQPIERYRYDAFGSPTILDPTTGTKRSESSYANRFLFTGREWIGEIKLYDYRNRQYDAELGRFLQTDPIGFAAGDINLYGYVWNEPTGWIDPFGLDAVPMEGGDCASFRDAGGCEAECPDNLRWNSDKKDFDKKKEHCCGWSGVKPKERGGGGGDGGGGDSNCRLKCLGGFADNALFGGLVGAGLQAANKLGGRGSKPRTGVSGGGLSKNNSSWTRMKTSGGGTIRRSQMVGRARRAATIGRAVGRLSLRAAGGIGIAIGVLSALPEYSSCLDRCK